MVSTTACHVGRALIRSYFGRFPSLHFDVRAYICVLLIPECIVEQNKSKIATKSSIIYIASRPKPIRKLYLAVSIVRSIIRRNK